MEREKLIDLFRKMATQVAERDFSHIAEDSKIDELGTRIDELEQANDALRLTAG